MPKIRCICGNVIGLGQIPGSNQELMITDIAFNKYWEDENPEIDKLYQEMTVVVKCPECERLYIFSNGFDKEPIVYRKEHIL